MGGVVREGLRALFARVVIKELDDKGLLGEVLRLALLERFCGGGLSVRRTLGQGLLWGHR